MPILATDRITFHLEFNDGTNDRPNFKRDAFDCTVSKSVYDAYWETADPKDYNVRERADGTTTLMEDVQPSKKTGGQDWYVHEQDNERSAGDHLCTEYSGNAGYKCTQIKCIVRRMADTTDPDDMNFDFKTSTSDDIVKVQKKHSYILFN